MLQTLPMRVLRKGERGLQACRMLVESCTLKGARGSGGSASLRSLCLLMDLCDYSWRKYFPFGEELRKGVRGGITALRTWMKSYSHFSKVRQVLQGQPRTHNHDIFTHGVRT